MSINNVNNLSSSSPIQKIVSNPIQKQVAPDAPAQLPATDRLELSGSSHLLQALKTNTGIRADKVASIKAQIQAGTYKDDAKLDGAVDKLLNDLNL
jgi:flagellar biosynthesis anti-sigma factor FlgM